MSAVIILIIIILAVFSVCCCLVTPMAEDRIRQDEEFLKWLKERKGLCNDSKYL